MTDQPSDREGALSPCPRCGSAAFLHEADTNSPTWTVFCRNLKCSLGTPSCESAAEAIEQWNPIAEGNARAARGAGDGVDWANERAKRMEKALRFIKRRCEDHQGGQSIGEFLEHATNALACPVKKQPDQKQPEPLPMILPCPKCGMLHVDGPEGAFYSGYTAKESEDFDKAHGIWTNPPHKSHLCHGCGTIWRPADVPTNGVASITTTGSKDTWKPGQKQAARGEDLQALLKDVRDCMWEHHNAKHHTPGSPMFKDGSCVVCESHPRIFFRIEAAIAAAGEQWVARGDLEGFIRELIDTSPAEGGQWFHRNGTPLDSFQWDVIQEAAIKALDGLGANASPWIACSARMPEVGHAYLTIHEDDDSTTAVRFLSDDNGRDALEWTDMPWDGEHGPMITHWMPLPKQPIQVGEQGPGVGL